MPYVLLIFGEMLLVSGIQGTQDDFFALLKNDFTGANSFIYWLAAIAVVGGIGYIPKMKPLSNAFLVLILVVLILHQNPQTLFSQFSGALKTSATDAPVTSPTVTAANANNVVSTASNAVSTVSKVAGSSDFITEALTVAGSFL